MKYVIAAFLAMTGCASIPVKVVHMPVFKVGNCLSLEKTPVKFNTDYDYVVQVSKVFDDNVTYLILERGEGYEFYYRRPVEYIDGSYTKVDCGELYQ